MRIEPLSIEGAFVVTPRQFPDDRGVFLESFRGDHLAQHLGHRPDIVQTNVSVSGRGTVRGIHFADVPPGQAKYVTCPAGAVLDVVVDVRVGSPTFGRWDAVLLDDVDRRAMYLSEGLGHAFMSLTHGSVLTYLCSTPYAPEREHAVDALDPALGIRWPTHGRDSGPLTPRLSAKDEAAPTLREAEAAGLLPVWSG
jgi:dTDP-4-dehydrorhamnose 3,5-epimerase